jgi:hypothetical protein
MTGEGLQFKDSLHLPAQPGRILIQPSARFVTVYLKAMISSEPMKGILWYIMASPIERRRRVKWEPRHSQQAT